jgi:N-acylneuraminate cytidylyltransferase
MKGHSERVPDKNLRLLAGRPLYHWVTMSLLDVPGIESVVVDTDSELIAEDVMANFPSLTVRKRPDDLVGDHVPMHSIVHRFAKETPTDIILQTHATNPLLTARTIGRALDAFASRDDHDSLMSVTPIRVRLYDSAFKPINHDSSNLIRTQDLAVIYEENSNLYIAERDMIITSGQRVGRDPVLFPIDRYEALDIDDADDFDAAELLIERFRK